MDPVKSEDNLDDLFAIEQAAKEAQRPQVARTRVLLECQQTLEEQVLETRILAISRWNPPRVAKSVKVFIGVSGTGVNAIPETKVSHSLLELIY